MRTRENQRLLSAILFVVAVIVAVGAYALLNPTYRETRAIQTFKKGISTSGKNFKYQVTLYQTLMKVVGPEKAQDVLVGTMPNNSWTHMIDHETGDYLYKTFGFAGVGKCKVYIGGACFHGFMIAMVADRGLGDVDKLVTACETTLADTTADSCPHGLGHALLQYVGYRNLPQALSLCQRTFAKDKTSASNCFDGVFMENGFGPRKAPLSEYWYAADDPMFPCDAKEVLNIGAHKGCWVMQSQATLHETKYPQFGGDVTKVAAYCNTLPPDDREICFDGIGKQVSWRSDNKIDVIRSSCEKLGSARGDKCVHTAMTTAYFYGDRSPDSPILHACESEKDTTRDACYEALYTGILDSYAQKKDQVAACQDLPEPAYRKACEVWLNSSATEIKNTVSPI